MKVKELKELLNKMNEDDEIMIMYEFMELDDDGELDVYCRNLGIIDVDTTSSVIYCE